MIIGVPKEIKSQEYRVAVVPAGVEQLRRAGHTVLVEQGAGVGSGFADQDYQSLGADLTGSADEIWRRAELICKVKEPLALEIKKIRREQVLFTYFHFAADRALTEGVRDSGCVAIAYETITDRHGRLPLLAPMSEVAGKMSIQEGAKYLEKPMMGRGILLGGIPGVEPANVLVLGGGIVGTCAARLAAGFGARVAIMDIDLYRLRYLDEVMPANVSTVFSALPDARAARISKADEARLGDCGRRRRSGRLLRDDQAHDARDADVRRRQRAPLRRGEHAWGGRPHQYDRPDERHDLVPGQARQYGLRQSGGGRSRLG
jgi:alanine dehydrogenase